MHEIQIAKDLSEIVLATAEKEMLSRVTKVNISLGKLVQIVPEIFETAFRECIRDSLASGSDLEIEIVEIRLKCRSCGNDFNPYESGFLCIVCGSGDIDILHGTELFIKSIEGDRRWKSK